MKRTWLTLLAVHLLLVPCFADVIPARRVDKDAAAEKAVQARLESLGVAPSQAVLQVSELTHDEVAYFAQNTARIQPAGRLYWYEWLFGAAVLAGVAWTAVYLSNEYNDQLD